MLSQSATFLLKKWIYGECGKVAFFKDTAVSEEVSPCQFCFSIALIICTRSYKRSPSMSKIMNGARAITAIELHKISEYLQVSMDSLMKMSEKPMDMSVIHSFMGRVKTEEARKGIQLADELSNMILFHAMVCENGKKMKQSWEDK